MRACGLPTLSNRRYEQPAEDKVMRAAGGMPLIAQCAPHRAQYLGDGYLMLFTLLQLHAKSRLLAALM